MKANQALTLIIVLLFAAACAPSGMPLQPASRLDRIVAGGRLRVGTAADMPPLTMLDRFDRAMGLDADLADEMARAMGVELRLEVRPRADLLPALAAGDLDAVISGVAITPRHNLKAALIGPYYLSGKALLSRFESMAATVDFDRFDAAAFAFVVQKGSSAARTVERRWPHARLVTVDSEAAAVDMVLSGTVDAMIADTHVCVMALLRHPDAGLVMQRTPFDVAPLGIALPPGDAQMINWTANFLDTLRESDTLVRLRKKWFEDPSWLSDLK